MRKKVVIVGLASMAVLFAVTLAVASPQRPGRPPIPPPPKKVRVKGMAWLGARPVPQGAVIKICRREGGPTYRLTVGRNGHFSRRVSTGIYNYFSVHYKGLTYPPTGGRGSWVRVTIDDPQTIELFFSSPPHRQGTR